MKHILTFMRKAGQTQAYCYTCKRGGTWRDTIEQARADAIAHTTRKTDEVRTGE